MASEFRPGHPLSFWIAVLVIIYGMYSGLFAMSHADDCKNQGSAQQHWSFYPPEWICDG